MRLNKLLGFVAVICMAVFVSASAASAVSIGSATVDPGDSTTVEIIAHNVTDLGLFGVTLDYDASVVSVTDVTHNPEIPDDWGISDVGDDGSMRIVSTGLEKPSLTGEEVLLVTLTLTAVGNAGDECDLDIAIVQLQQTDSTDINATEVDGTFTIAGGSEESASAVSIGSATVDPGDSTTVEIIAHNVTELGLFGVTLDYDASVVSVTDVTHNPEIPDDWGISDVGDDGSMRIVSTGLEKPSLTGEEVLLVTLTLTAVGNAGDECDLDIAIVQLQQTDSTDINATEVDGTFTISGEVPTDTTPPVITDVVYDTPTTDSVNITWTTDEDSGSLVKYGTVSGTYTVTVVLPDAAMTTLHSIMLTGLDANTAYYFVVNSTDSSDNSNESAEYNFTTAAQEDLTPPTIHSVLLDPTEVAPSGTINVTVNVTDNSSIASVTADNVSLTDVGNDTYEGTITAPSTAGTYNVTVVAIDNSTNSNSVTDDSATYTVKGPGDTTPPTIHSVLLDPTEVAPSGTINVTVNVTDNSSIASVTADNVSLTDVGNDTYEGTITAPSTAGTYNVTVVAIDNSTNSNSVTDDSATYTVKGPGDTTPPTIHSVLLDPTEVAPSGTINVTVNVTDNSSIASVTADNVSLTDVGNDTYEGTITAPSTAGTYNVTVVAIDNSTNSNSVTDDSATYTVKGPGDTTPPTIHSVLLDPTEVAPSGTINVTVNVTDNSSIASVTADNVSLTDVGNDTYEGTITAPSTAGTYNVTVVAIDNSTNSNSVTDDSATYTVKGPGDTTPPTIHSVLLDPTEVAPSGTINVTVNVTDNSSIASVTADNVSLTDVGNDTYEGTITAPSTAGTYNVTVVAIDNSTNSNSVTDDSATYTVQDPPVPQATCLHIEDVTVRRGESETVPITVFNVTDMGGCEITFTYDPTVVYVTDVARGDLNFSFEYNINNGSGWMRANALDVDGQSGDVIFAYITLDAVGNKSDTSEMEFEYSRLADTSFGDITHVRDNGTFSILPNELPDVTNVSATPATILYDNGRPRTPGTNLTSLSAYVTDVDGSIATVTIDLSSIGGLPDEPMEYVSGDLWMVTTNATEVAINVPDFDHQLTITATDDDGGINDSVSIELIVLKRGDVNGDGSVDKADADYISRYLAGLEPEASNPPGVLVGDVIGDAGSPVGDGVVDLMDALYIAKYTDNPEEEP